MIGSPDPQLPPARRCRTGRSASGTRRRRPRGRPPATPGWSMKPRNSTWSGDSEVGGQPAQCLLLRPRRPPGSDAAADLGRCRRDGTHQSVNGLARDQPADMDHRDPTRSRAAALGGVRVATAWNGVMSVECGARNTRSGAAPSSIKRSAAGSLLAHTRCRLAQQDLTRDELRAIERCSECEVPSLWISRRAPDHRPYSAAHAVENENAPLIPPSGRSGDQRANRPRRSVEVGAVLPPIDQPLSARYRNGKRSIELPTQAAAAAMARRRRP